MRCKVLLLASLISSSLSYAQHSFKILHAFAAGLDGGGAYAGLTLDAKGNLYGTTVGGGAYGAGTVFRLKSETNGLWSETILHHFGSLSSGDGEGPLGGVVVDSTGNVYGTTETSGRYHRAGADAGQCGSCSSRQTGSCPTAKLGRSISCTALVFPRTTEHIQKGSSVWIIGGTCMALLSVAN